MEKLLQLLNEYNCEKLGYVDKWITKNDKFMLDYKIGTYSFRSHLYIISKEYGFIQRLDNEGKIDYAKVEDLCYRDVNLFFSNRDFFGRYKRLLMLLAIQDDPISFLVSILK